MCSSDLNATVDELSKLARDKKNYSKIFDAIIAKAQSAAKVRLAERRAKEIARAKN